MSQSVDLTVCATRMSDDRQNNYHSSTSKRIIQTINGLLNAKCGGKLRINYDEPCPPQGHREGSLRRIEQKVCEFAGVATFVHAIHINKRKCGIMQIIVAASKSKYLYTLKYNLYLPTDQQVVEVSPKDPVENVRDILCAKIPSPEAGKPGSHLKEFTLGAPVSIGESRTAQFKHLSTGRTKSTNLAQRLINNKFEQYVSAFANYRGGHIYVGIDNQGEVQGETITQQDRTELKETISKVIKKMIWPENSLTQDEEEKRWQIDFEPVKHRNGELVASTFVIVIYVAHCPGGVFTKFPESYEIRENEAKLIDFSKWKRNIVGGLEITEGGRSEKLERTNEATFEANTDKILTKLLNDDCGWSVLKRAAEEAESTHDSVNVKLICLAKLIKFCLRKGDCKMADEMLKEYRKLKATLAELENVKFYLMEEYLCCLKERSLGNFEASYKIAMGSLKKLEKIEPGVFSAAYFALIATVLNMIAIKKNTTERGHFITKAKEFYDKAENHLLHLSHEFKAAEIDLRQKICVNKAILLSGSSLDGSMLPDYDASVINTDEAKKCIDRSQRIVTHEMVPPSNLRLIQKLFAQSDLFRRVGKIDMAVEDNQMKVQIMMGALKLAKRAEHTAKEAGLMEMKYYAENRVRAIETQSLVLRS